MAWGYPGERLLHVERYGAVRLAARIGRDLVDAGLRLAQQFLAAALQGLAALIDRYRFFQRSAVSGPRRVHTSLRFLRAAPCPPRAASRSFRAPRSRAQRSAW